jgi:hypothetical protein
LNGESRKDIAVAFVSFGAGAVIAALLGNSATRAKLTDGTRKLLRITEK